MPLAPTRACAIVSRDAIIPMLPRACRPVPRPWEKSTRRDARGSASGCWAVV